MRSMIAAELRRMAGDLGHSPERLRDAATEVERWPDDDRIDRLEALHDPDFVVFLTGNEALGVWIEKYGAPGGAQTVDALLDVIVETEERDAAKLEVERTAPDGREGDAEP